MSYGFKAYLYNFLFTNSPENETTICSVLCDNILNSNISDEIHGVFQCIHQRSLVLNISSHQPCSFEWWNCIFLWIKASQVDLQRIAAEGGTWSVFLVLLCASCQLHWEYSIFYIFTSKDHFKILGTKHLIPAATSTVVTRKELRIIRIRCEDSSKWISNVNGNQRIFLVLEALCNWPMQNFWYIQADEGRREEREKKEGREREGERKWKEKLFMSCKPQKTFWKEGAANMDSYLFALVLKFGSDFLYIVKIIIEIITEIYKFKINNF